LYLQFLDLYGNPIYLRPERVDALRGIATTWNGTPRAATLIVMTNRETFRVRGHVDTVKDGIEAWLDANTPKMMVGEVMAFDVMSRRSCENLAEHPVDAVATFDINGKHVGRSFSPSDFQPTPRPSRSQYLNAADFEAAIAKCQGTESPAPADTDNTL
jgi:hypothetical protein